MAYTYKINEAKISLLYGKDEYRKRNFVIIRSILQFLIRFLIFSFTFIGTWKIFNLCIKETFLVNTITLGAIFATLGSAIVSIFSLYCNEQFNQFSENSKILYKKLIGSENWERWPFLKRVRRYKIDKKQFESQILENPSIIFFDTGWNITIPLPSSKTDFYEISVYRHLYQLRRKRLEYRIILSKHKNSDVLKEILLWDCLIGIYENITLYKFGKAMIWLGGCLILNSIIFSLSYNSMIVILSRYF